MPGLDTVTVADNDQDKVVADTAGTRLSQEGNAEPQFRCPESAAVNAVHRS